MPSKALILAVLSCLAACKETPAEVPADAAPVAVDSGDAIDGSATDAPDTGKPLDSGGVSDTESVDVQTANGTDAATSDSPAPDTQAIWGCAATCGNGVCDPGEAPGSCSDCQAGAGLACMESQCAAELAACSPKPGCQNLASCLGDCGGTPACAQGCKKFGTTGVLATYDSLVACMAAKGCMAGCGNGSCDAGESSGTCAVDCKAPVAGNHLCEQGETPLTCGFDCGVADVMGCEKQACPAQWNACAADASCAPVLTCYSDCKGFDCSKECQTKFGNKLPAGLLAVFSCGNKVCGNKFEDACGNGLCHGEATSCPNDCTATAAQCGNGACESGESAKICPGDCGPATDAFSCMAKHCANFDTACKADASCAAGLACLSACPLDAKWKDCRGQCLGKMNGMGVWLYLPLARCADEHGCRPELPAYCGDSVCQSGETATNCQGDCYEPVQCGDGYCSAPTEDLQTCPADCATCETKGCGGKPGLLCCKVSGKWDCAHQAKCDE